MLGVEYFVVFGVITRLDIVHMITALVDQKKWEIHQIDVK